MAKAKINGAKIKEAIDEFGSLKSAIDSRKAEKTALEKQVSDLKEERQHLALDKDKLLAEIEGLKKQFEAEKARVEGVAARVGKWERQYKLFESFVGMLAGSPSVDSSLKGLISLFEELDKSGWITAKLPEDLRAYFLSKVIGDYLKCFRCKTCGARFIVNKQPQYKGIGINYHCPVCWASSGIEPDDAFLKAMVSEAKLQDILTVRDIQEENDALRPLKPFLSVPCEICGKPITEWAEKSNVWAAINGCGWCHDGCWNTELGKLKFGVNLKKMIQEKQ